MKQASLATCVRDYELRKDGIFVPGECHVSPGRRRVCRGAISGAAEGPRLADGSDRLARRFRKSLIHKSPDPREESLPAAPFAQPCGLVSMGPGSGRESPEGAEADFPFRGILQLPLVPRDGAGIVFQSGTRDDPA